MSVYSWDFLIQRLLVCVPFASQVGTQWFQSANAFNNPDMLTIGMGGMTEGQYRAEVFLYAVLGAPLVLRSVPIR